MTEFKQDVYDCLRRAAGRCIVTGTRYGVRWVLVMQVRHKVDYMLNLQMHPLSPGNKYGSVEIEDLESGPVYTGIRALMANREDL